MNPKFRRPSSCFIRDRLSIEAQTILDTLALRAGMKHVPDTYARHFLEHALIVTRDKLAADGNWPPEEIEGELHAHAIQELLFS